MYAESKLNTVSTGGVVAGVIILLLALLIICIVVTVVVVLRCVSSRKALISYSTYNVLFT